MGEEREDPEDTIANPHFIAGLVLGALVPVSIWFAWWAASRLFALLQELPSVS